jgi:aquaporin Z
MSLGRRCFAEFLGTLFLVFAGCGSAVLAAKFPEVGIGLVGVAFSFGLVLMVTAFAIGGISGCHVNPAVTIGLAAARRFPGKDVVPYLIAQVLGGIAGTAILYAIASGGPEFSLSGGFASNGYGAHSPGQYTMVSGLVYEVVATFFFVFVIIGATSSPSMAAVAPIAIGFALTVAHLVGIPVTNTSVNPARSTGPAVFVGGWALAQLWFFWVFPIIGGLLAGLIYPALKGRETES